jgi:hypothetical protein
MKIRTNGTMTIRSVATQNAQVVRSTGSKVLNAFIVDDGSLG